VNAEELRRALQVGVITARRIRDEVNAELFGGDDGDAGAQR